MNRSVFALASLLAAGVAYGEPPAAESAKKPEFKSWCIKDTGTRIPRSENQCVPLPGRVLTREDIQRTGEVDLGRAINKLVP